MNGVTCQVDGCDTTFYPLLKVVIDAGEDYRPTVEVSFAHLEQHFAEHVVKGDSL